MILSEEELDARLNSKDNIINLLDSDPYDRQASPVIIEPLHGDVGKRGPGLPDRIRELIAQTAGNSGETQAEIGRVFGVGTPTVSNSQRGLIHNRLDKDLQAIAERSTKERVNEAHEAALDNLMAGLGLVQDRLVSEHLDGLSLKESVKLTVDMSRVVAVLKPAEEDEHKVKTLVVIKMPSVKKEAQFETIDV